MSAGQHSDMCLLQAAVGSPNLSAAVFFMSEATRLQNRIDRTQARLDAVSAQYDSILAAASSSNGDTSFSNQSLDAVGRERRSLEEELAELYRQQEALTGESGGGTSLPTFQSPSATTT